VKVTVRSIGTLRQILGAAELKVTVPEGTTVWGLLSHLEKEKGEGFAPYVSNPQKAGAYAPLRVLLNGRDVPLGQQEKTVLAETDDVLIFAPIAGG
jgi:molybdopterin converting factor small subunit